MHKPVHAVAELPVVFIAGPTATGKTELGMRLADRREVDLINVDAAQVYRQMNIGTAKLDAESLRRYPHALIDIRDPSEVYDASQFVRDARALIRQAHMRGRIPVLVGGTLFYFAALEKGVSSLPGADAGIRLELEKEAGRIGWDGLYRQLETIDPDLCRTLRAGDRQRIQRAMEIYRVTGKAPSQAMAESRPQPLAEKLFKFNLYTPDRRLLHARIEARFEQMLEHGLIQEVEALRNRGDLHLDLPSMRCVGYRQVWHYLEGKLEYADMLARGVAATRQLAKRQLTWLRHQRGQVWLSSEYENNADLVLHFLS